MDKETLAKLARLEAYDRELTAVMPEDFKDWHQNSKNEWPQIAALVIKNLRQREDEAWALLEDDGGVQTLIHAVLRIFRREAAVADLVLLGEFLSQLRSALIHSRHYDDLTGEAGEHFHHGLPLLDEASWRYTMVGRGL